MKVKGLPRLTEDGDRVAGGWWDCSKMQEKKGGEEARGVLKEEDRCWMRREREMRKEGRSYSHGRERAAATRFSTLWGKCGGRRAMVRARLVQ